MYIGIILAHPVLHISRIRVKCHTIPAVHSNIHPVSTQLKG
jgi:hypothetical protein